MIPKLRTNEQARQEEDIRNCQGEEDEREEREKEEYEGEEDGSSEELEFNQHRSFSLILRYLQHISCSAIFLSNFQVLDGTKAHNFKCSLF